jgi:hypothetical protein
MDRHDTCAKQCSISAFMKLEEEACEDGYCEKQQLTNDIFEQGPLARRLEESTKPRTKGPVMTEYDWPNR